MRVLREPPVSDALTRAIERAGTPLHDPRSLDPLLDRVGSANRVLLGEASHGTSEYYTWRAEITKRLITEKGFRFVAVEGDWPACMELNRYVRGESERESAHEALRAFHRWPTWMWANQEVENLAEWMRGHNARLPAKERIGFYGLDVYSLWESMEAVLGWLRENQHEALPAAMRAFECFEPYGRDEQGYAAAASGWVPRSCEKEVVKLLDQMRNDSLGRDDEAFDAEQNALVLKNAENYYRIMVAGGPDSWNLRDTHMHETFERLMDHNGPDARGIAWEHNTHIGDARHTDMAAAGMHNIGQLAREASGEDDVVLVGFGTHRGSVIAGRYWGGAMRRMDVPPARPDSWEDALHLATPGDQLLMMDALRDDDAAMEWRGHRAIGVVYEASRESWGNYVPSVLPQRYDAFLHIDETRALEPLHVPVAEGEVAETWPFGT